MSFSSDDTSGKPNRAASFVVDSIRYQMLWSESEGSDFSHTDAISDQSSITRLDSCLPHLLSACVVFNRDFDSSLLIYLYSQLILNLFWIILSWLVIVIIIVSINSCITVVVVG